MGRTLMFSQPPPVGGLNTRDDIGTMASNDAAVLENWFPETTAVVVRGGCRHHASVSAATNFEALAEFATPAQDAIVVGSGGTLAIYDSVTNAVYASGFTRNDWQAVNFNETMELVNGFDYPQHVAYNGSYTITPSTVSGPSNVRNLVDAHVFKTRVFYVERDSADFWYTETNAIAGTLTKFPLSRVARRGGHLLTIKSWSVDGGDGPDDYAVFFMSTGEVIVYQGTDPGRSGSWGLVGRYQIPELIDRRCVHEHAGKIFCVTVNDLVILPDAFTQATPPPSKLTGAISADWAKYKNLRGWQFVVHPRGGKAFINVPTGALTSHQYVINLQTGSPTKYTGWNTFGFGQWNNSLYFNPYGTAGLVEADSGIGDELATGVISSITARAQCAPSNLGQQQYKKLVDYRLRLVSEGTVTLSSGLAYDYKTPDFYFSDSQTTAGTAWGSPWGSSWSGEDYTKDVWLGASGNGVSVQLRMELVANRQDCRWLKTDYRFEVTKQVA